MTYEEQIAAAAEISKPWSPAVIYTPLHHLEFAEISADGALLFGASADRKYGVVTLTPAQAWELITFIRHTPGIAAVCRRAFLARQHEHLIQAHAHILSES